MNRISVGSDLCYCHLCDLSFSKADMQVHVLTHPGPYPCVLCYKVFDHWWAYGRHIKTHQHGVRVYNCPECGKGHRSELDLEIHLYNHKVGMPHTCPHCGKGFMSPARLQTHVDSHLGVKRHACSVCDRRFHRHSHLKDHLKKHHPGELERQEVLRASGVKPHVCAVCDRGFQRQANLEKHMMREHPAQDSSHTQLPSFESEGKVHICPYCKKGYLRPPNLKMHIQTVHQREAGVAGAGVCSRPTPNDKLVKAFNCAYCDRGYKRAANLKMHVQTFHLDEPAVQAALNEDNISPVVRADRPAPKPQVYLDYDGDPPQTSVYDSAVSLDQRWRPLQSTSPSETHTYSYPSVAESDPYLCLHCSCGFGSLASIETHMRGVHRPDTTYSTCSQCIQGFHDTSDLRDHIATHDMDMRAVNSEIEHFATHKIKSEGLVAQEGQMPALYMTSDRLAVPFTGHHPTHIIKTEVTSGENEILMTNEIKTEKKD